MEVTPATAPVMTPEELRSSGEALFGYGWQTRMARHYRVADRTVRRWAAGTAPIPATIAASLRDLIALRPPDASPAEDRDDAARAALAPHLDKMASDAERSGWHPAEVVAATLDWAIERGAEGAGIAAMIETLRGAIRTLQAERDD